MAGERSAAAEERREGEVCEPATGVHRKVDPAEVEALRGPDAHRVDGVTLCDACETTAAIVRHSGQWRRCTCGVAFNPAARLEADDDAPDESPAAPVEREPVRLEELVAWARPRWPTVRDEVELARRYAVRESYAPPSLSPLARLQGQATGLSRDASEHQVAMRWALLQREDDGGEKVRANFRAFLAEWLARHVRAGEEVDWDHAARCWERLYRIDGDAARVLLVVRVELATDATWEAAARVVADACAPRTLRAVWSAREATERGLVGRPRRSVVEPPVDAERLAWGEPRLAAAMEAWVTASRK